MSIFRKPLQIDIGYEYDMTKVFKNIIELINKHKTSSVLYFHLHCQNLLLHFKNIIMYKMFYLKTGSDITFGHADLNMLTNFQNLPT